jgi:hypothetical protein
MRGALGAAVAAALLLAGCGEPAATTPPATSGPPPLEEGKGAITGLLINDVYRPIPGALVLLQQLGLTASTDAAGQFHIADLEPGAYLLKVQAEGHAAAPRTVEVKAGEYTEVEWLADRLANEGSRIVTSQYSVFIDCSFEAVVVAGTGAGCTLDQSGDSTRTGFDTDLSGFANVTYVVTEVKFNKPGDYGIVLGLMDGANVYYEYYAEGDIFGADYLKIVNQPGVANEAQNAGGRNVPFDLNQTYTTSVFPHGAGYQAIHEATEVEGVSGGAFGAGVALGVEAQFVQSIFIGPPEQPIESYRTMS